MECKSILSSFVFVGLRHQRQGPLQRGRSNSTTSLSYAATKAAASFFATTYVPPLQTSFVCLRFFTVYGHGSDLIGRSINSPTDTSGKPIRFFGDERREEITPTSTTSFQELWLRLITTKVIMRSQSCESRPWSCAN